MLKREVPAPQQIRMKNPDLDEAKLLLQRAKSDPQLGIRCLRTVELNGHRIVEEVAKEIPAHFAYYDPEGNLHDLFLEMIGESGRDREIVLYRRS